MAETKYDLSKLRQPIWIRDNKSGLACKLVTGGEIAEDKFRQDGTPNSDFDAIVEHFTEAVIDKNTEENERQRAEQEEIAKSQRAGDERRRKNDLLYAAKSEAFALPEVIAADVAIKTRIRKSKNIVEINALAGALIAKSLAV